jgi:GT2 family glycosyltransferase/LmbE family N-acetylglucosaminyl deacetylase
MRTQSPSSVAVVVPYFGRTDLVTRAVRRLREVAPRGTMVVLVDDATPLEDEVEAQADIHLRLPENRGFTAAVNIGLEAAFRHVPICVLLNSDALVVDGAIQALTGRISTSPHIGVVGGIELDPADQDLVVAAGGRDIFVNGAMTPLDRLERRGRLSAGDFSSSEEVPWVGFAIAAISRSCFESVGRLDERFRNYFSDADFCLRARLLGYSVVIDPAARVIHAPHSTTGLRTARSLMSLQTERESYCKKWLPSGFAGDRGELRLLRFGAREWSPHLVPHLSPDAPGDYRTVELLTARGITGEDLDIVRRGLREPARDRGEHWNARFRKLYSRGLAYVTCLSTLRYANQYQFLSGVPLLVIEPHPDDAALSVGGTLVSRRLSGAATSIVTVFSRSGYARPPYDRLGQDHISRVRRFESAVYASRVGASFKGCGLEDALTQHRAHNPLFVSDINDVDLDLVGAAAGAVARHLPQTLTAMLAPLGAGGMVDHVATAIGTTIAAQKYSFLDRLLFYEDLPYAGQGRAIAGALEMFCALGVELEPVAIDVSPFFEEKLELLAIYLSQAEETWRPTLDAHARALAEIAIQGEVADWRRVERFWRLSA